MGGQINEHGTTYPVTCPPYVQAVKTIGDHTNEDLYYEYKVTFSLYCEEPG
jgi:hypothetical protein